MEYDFFDLENGLKVASSIEEVDQVDVEINITPEEYLSSITEEKLQKSQEFHNKIDEHHAKAISEAYNYVVF